VCVCVCVCVCLHICKEWGAYKCAYLCVSMHAPVRVSCAFSLQVHRYSSKGNELVHDFTHNTSSCRSVVFGHPETANAEML
jgi:hypothetical protein